MAFLRVAMQDIGCHEGPSRRMGREAHQGEVGLVIGDEYLAFRDFSKE
jgi:hypothetical protein